jgi:hypothetical protein
MSKAAFARLVGVNVEAVHQFLEQNKKKKWTVEELADHLLANGNTLLPANWKRESARRQAKEYARALMQTAQMEIGRQGKPRQARLFHHVENRQEVVVTDSYGDPVVDANGTPKKKTIIVHEYVRYDGLSFVQWQEHFVGRRDGIERDQRDLNADSIVFNLVAPKKGWAQMDLPYPEVEEDD